MFPLSLLFSSFPPSPCLPSPSSFLSHRPGFINRGASARSYEKFVALFNKGIKSTTIALAMRVHAQEVAKQQQLLQDEEIWFKDIEIPPFFIYQNKNILGVAEIARCAMEQEQEQLAKAASLSSPPSASSSSPSPSS
jgi:hypothetical protein